MARLRTAALATFFSCLPAAADARSAPPHPVTEQSHTIDIDVVPGAALLRVRRTILNGGPATAEFVVRVDLPRGGVITGLSVDAGEAEVQLADSQTAALYLPRVPARARRTVDYTIEVPLASQDGQGTVLMAESEVSATDGRAPVIVRHNGAVLTPVPATLWIPYHVPAPTPREGQLRWGVAPLPRGAVWRAEVDAPHELGRTPKGARVVFIIDRSRSQTRRGVERQLRLIARWAREMPDAEYQVVAHAREAESLFARPSPAAALQALSADDPRLVPTHGSNLDAAITRAAEALAGVAGPAYLVVMTDGELPTHLEPNDLRGLLSPLPPAVTVHLLLTDGRETHGAIESRADDDRLAGLALDHGGVPMRVLVLEEFPVPTDALVLANLLRPQRIDSLALEVDGQSGPSMECAPLREHTGCEYDAVVQAAPGAIAAVGWVWTTPWRADGSRSAALDRRAAVFATHGWFEAPDQTWGHLDDATLKWIGHTYAIVTTQTALRANKDRTKVARPTPLDPELFGMGGLGLVGVGGRATKTETEPESLAPAQLLASFSAGIDACAASRRGPALRMTLAVETNRDELLDVTVDGGDEATRQCIAESAWSTLLGERYAARRAAGTLAIDLPERVAPASVPVRAEQPPAVTAMRRGCRVGDDPLPVLGLLMLLTPRRRRAVKSRSTTRW